MMAKRGKMGWLPKYLIDEAEQVMREDGINKRSYALEKVVKYAQVGREVNRLRQLGYDWTKKEKPVQVSKKNKRKEWW